MGTSLKPSWRGWKPVDLTEEFLRELSKRIKGGATPEVAARSLGLPGSRFRKWMRAGEEDVEEAFETGERHHALTWFGRLYIAVGIATGDLAIELAGDIKAGHEHAREKQWLLERLEREDYGSKPSEGDDGGLGDGNLIVVIEEGQAALENALGLLAATRTGALVGGRVLPEILPPARDVLPDPPADQRPADRVPGE